MFCIRRVMTVLDFQQNNMLSKPGSTQIRQPKKILLAIESNWIKSDFRLTGAAK
ncbi:hypothetical protein D3C86_981550 [compost metagenome]